MRKPGWLTVAVVLLAGSGAVRGAGGEAEAQKQSSAGAWPAALERVQLEDLGATAPVLVRIHLASQLDVALARLAQERSTRPEVRRLGRLVAADVQRADEAIVRYAKSRRDLDLEAATRVIDHTRALQRHVADVEARMKQVPGGSFDQPYLLVMSTMVDETLELLGEGWRTAQDPRLRAEIVHLGNLMRQHQEVARAIAARTPPPQG
jgi:predicted outer membrane protein